ncbi:hypothetical protein D3C71_1624420 [compost metagenome]
MAWIYVSTKVDTHQEQAMTFRQIAGICRRRGGSGCGGVSAMDGAPKPPWMDSRRPPQPDPPCHPTECRLLPLPLPLPLPLLLLRPLRVQGAALPGTPPSAPGRELLQHLPRFQAACAKVMSQHPPHRQAQAGQIGGVRLVVSCQGQQC